MKLKRDTEPARLAAIAAKDAKRAAKKREIIHEMCPEYCNRPSDGGWCRDGTPPCKAELTGCLSLKFVADHLNRWDIETLKGKTGSWRASTVGNVFKEEQEQLKADTTTIEKPADHAGIIW